MGIEMAACQHLAKWHDQYRPRCPYGGSHLLLAPCVDLFREHSADTSNSAKVSAVLSLIRGTLYGKILQVVEVKPAG